MEMVLKKSMKMKISKISKKITEKEYRRENTGNKENIDE